MCTRGEERVLRRPLTAARDVCVLSPVARAGGGQAVEVCLSACTELNAMLNTGSTRRNTGETQAQHRPNQAQYGDPSCGNCVPQLRSATVFRNCVPQLCAAPSLPRLCAPSSLLPLPLLGPFLPAFSSLPASVVLPNLEFFSLSIVAASLTMSDTGPAVALESSVESRPLFVWTEEMRVLLFLVDAI